MFSPGSLSPHPLGDVLPGLLHDPDEVRGFPPVSSVPERDADPSLASPASPANPVDILLHVLHANKMSLEEQQRDWRLTLGKS